MADGNFVIPGSNENDKLRQPVDDFFVASTHSEIDYPTQKRVDEIIDHYPEQVIERALEADARSLVDDAFDQILIEHPELYGLMYDVAEGVGVDAELERVTAKPDILKPSLKERAFGVIFEKEDLRIRLVNAESDLGGRMFGNE